MSVISFEIENDFNSRVDMDENLYDYISSSFFWITSFWTDGKKRLGIDIVGVSLINEDIPKLKKILLSWENLLSNAPEIIKVVVGYDVCANLEITGEIEKKECLSQLKKIAKLCELATLQKKNIIVYGL